MAAVAMRRVQDQSRRGVRRGHCAAHQGVDGIVLLHNNEGVHVEFTQSARRHKVGKARVRQVLANPIVVERIVQDRAPKIRLLILGDDGSGRAVEVIAVEGDGVLVVIHAMDLRSKCRALYEEGKRS